MVSDIDVPYKVLIICFFISLLLVGVPFIFNLSILKFIGYIGEKEQLEEEMFNKTVGACKKMTDLSERDKCLFKEAIKTFDEGKLYSFDYYKKYCKEISEEKLRESCSDNYLIIDAGVAGECGFIENIEIKDLCIYHGSINGIDLRYCSAISNTELKEKCFSKILSHKEELIENCKQETYPDVCFGKLAKKFIDANICKYGEDIDFKNRCLWELAVQQENITLCQTIADKKQKESCIGGIAARTNNVELCKGLTITTKDSCLNDIALKTNNAKLCEEITKKELKEGCFYNIAVKTNRTDLCKKAGDTLSVDSCLLAIASVTQNRSICSKIQISWKQEFCIAATGTDPELCDVYEEPYAKDKCFYNMAIRTNNIEICQNIVIDTELKTTCLNEVKIN